MPNYFTKTCSGSEAGPYLRLTDCVYHSTLGFKVIKQKRRNHAFIILLHPPSSKRRGSTLEGLMDCQLNAKAKARFWP